MARRLSRKDETLRKFRADHHYHSKLKYWPEYQRTFEYIDAKAQGLLAAAAIIGAIFLLVLEPILDPDDVVTIDPFHQCAIFFSYLGVILVVVAAIVLMRCFYADADNYIEKRPELVGAFEEAFDQVMEAPLEAEIDSFIKLYTKHAFAVPDIDHEIGLDGRRRSCAELVHYCMRLGNSQGSSRPVEEILGWDAAAFWRHRRELEKFRLLKSRADCMFKALRFSVEKEINQRRARYKLARRLVLIALWILLGAVMVLLPDVIGGANNGAGEIGAKVHAGH